MQKNITVLGIGSLLCPESARKTCPALGHFRVGYVTGYRRIFNKMNTVQVLRGNPLPPDKACASVSAIPDGDTIGDTTANTTMAVSVFNIRPEAYPALLRREFDYKLEPVPYTDAAGHTDHGLLCIGNFANDAECAALCATDPIRAEMWQAYLNATTEPLWRNDLLPTPDYLAFCLNAAHTLGDDIYENFLDTTYLGDNTTTIRQYLGRG